MAGGTAPFSDHNDLHGKIDATTVGDVPWQSFNVVYDGEGPATNAPEWMSKKYDVWFRDPQEVVRNLLANPNIMEGFDHCPYREFRGGKRRWSSLMSGNWAWKQAVSFFNIRHYSLLTEFIPQDIISQDESTHGSMFIPIVLGSDKTTVSVATGDNEFYPLYMSIGNVSNNVHHTHKNALVLIAFLSIPKGM